MDKCYKLERDVSCFEFYIIIIETPRIIMKRFNIFIFCKKCLRIIIEKFHLLINSIIFVE